MKTFIQKKTRAEYLFISCVFLATAILCFFVPPLAEAARFIVNIFATGFSYVKLYLFLGSGFFLFLILSLKIRISRTVKRSTFIRAVAIFAVAGFLMNVIFMISHGISPREDAFVISGGNFSENKIIHTHVLKQALSAPLRIFGDFGSGAYDAGYPFLSFFPLWMSILLSGFFAWLIVSFFLITVHRHAEWDDEKRKIFFPLLFVSGFSMLKSVIDGGLLSYEFLLSFPFFILALRADRRDIFPKGKNPFFLYLLSFLILYPALIKTLYPATDFYEILLHYSVAVALLLFFLLLILIPIFIHEKKRRFLIPAFLFLIAIPLLLGKSFAAHQITYLFRTVEKGEFLRILAPARDDVRSSYNAGDSAIYDVENEARKKMFSLMKEWRANPSFYPIISVGNDCISDVPFVVSGEIVSEKKTGLTIREQDELIRTLRFDACANGECDFKFSFELRGCVPNPHTAVFSYITHMGFDTFIVKNYRTESFQEYLKERADEPTESSKEKKAVIIVLESARAAYFDDYKEEMPFLHSIAARGCFGSTRPVSPTFSAANALALLTGTYPERNGLFHIIYLDDRDEFVLAASDSITPFYSKEKGVKTLSALIEGNDRDVTHLESSDDLRFFEYTADAHALSVIWVLDTESELYGDLEDNEALRKKFSNLDRNLRNFHRTITERFPNAMFLFLGDHGISEVKERREWKDVKAIIEKAGISLDTANIWIDAGVGVRIWERNPEEARAHEEKLRKAFSEDSCFYVVDKESKEAMRAPHDRYRTGDITIGARAGCVIGTEDLPQEYKNVPEEIIASERELLGKRELENSMHGYYDATHKDLQAFFVIDGAGLSCKNTKADIVDFAPTIAEYLGVQTDFSDFQGMSLYEKILRVTEQ